MSFSLYFLRIIVEDVEDDSEGGDDEDVSLDLSSIQVMGGEPGSVILPSGYQTVGSGIFYSEEWDEEAQLVEELE